MGLISRKDLSDLPMNCISTRDLSMITDQCDQSVRATSPRGPSAILDQSDLNVKATSLIGLSAITNLCTSLIDLMDHTDPLSRTLSLTAMSLIDPKLMLSNQFSFRPKSKTTIMSDPGIQGDLIFSISSHIGLSTRGLISNSNVINLHSPKDKSIREIVLKSRIMRAVDQKGRSTRATDLKGQITIVIDLIGRDREGRIT